MFENVETEFQWKWAKIVVSICFEEQNFAFFCFLLISPYIVQFTFAWLLIQNAQPS